MRGPNKGNWHGSDKRCYCHSCGKAFHYLGIATHRWGHRNRREDCRITYSNGDTYTHYFSEKES